MKAKTCGMATPDLPQCPMHPFNIKFLSARHLERIGTFRRPEIASEDVDIQPSCQAIWRREENRLRSLVIKRKVLTLRDFVCLRPQES